MKAIAPGTVIFHRYRGYGVMTSVNLLTGWVAARFGSEVHTLDLNLSSDEIEHADGTPIRFRRDPPERMPHARLMAMVVQLHQKGFQRLYMYNWPKASGLHWRWHLFAGPRNWVERPWREGWYGSGADYNFNPVMGWGDQPGADTQALIAALAHNDPEGLAQARGRDEDHTEWFAKVAEALLPNYAFRLGWDQGAPMPQHLPVFAVRNGVPPYEGPALPWPPGWANMWQTGAVSDKGARPPSQFSGVDLALSRDLGALLKPQD